MKSPSGLDLMEILIKLLEDQEGVEIKYELEGEEDVSRMQTVAL